jgi:hypothetical protein
MQPQLCPSVNVRDRISRPNKISGKIVHLYILIFTKSRDSAVGIVTGYGVKGPSKVKICLFSIASKPALGPTQPPVQWVPGVLSPG